MSSTETFIDEVAEEVRRDKLMLAARRYGWIAVLVIVGVVGGAAYWEWQKARAEAEARANGTALLAAMQGTDVASQIVRLQEAAVTGDAATLRDFLLLGLQSRDDARSAVEGLQAILADQEVRPIYRDVARLRLLQLPDNILTTDQRLDLVEPMVLPGHPFRLTGLELRALLYIEQRDTDAALQDLATLISDAEVSQVRRQRAVQLIIVLGGDPEAL